MTYKKSVRGVNKLFDVIGKHGSLFEGNFNKYYKNMIKDGNPYSIFSDFLTDVVSHPDVRDPSLVKECAILIRALKKSMGQVPSQFKEEVGKVSGIMDSIIDALGEFSDLDADPEISEDDLKKMISELELKFNVK
jgi:hypothetical protein